MNSFFIGLQFLTRISIVRQEVWTEKSFGESVKFFPLIGAVLGICYVITISGIFFLTSGNLPIFTGVFAFLMFAAFTGGIHFDGLSDTADGLFSGREREKILEIMKDSRLGTFGALSLISVALTDVAILAELSKISFVWLCVAVYSAPVIGRFMMVCTIGFFPYARPEGMGKSFAKFTTRKTIFIAAVETIFLLLPLFFWGKEIFLATCMALIAAMIFTFRFGKFATKKIGGVTGDIYGAVTTLAETLVLTFFLISVNSLTKIFL